MRRRITQNDPPRLPRVEPILWTTCLAVLLATFVSLSADAQTSTDPLSLNDFAVGRLLEASESGVLHSVVLDYDVYRRSVEPDLADLRVFDADGRPSTYAIRRRVPIGLAEIEAREVPVFVLRESEPGASNRSRVEGIGGYRIDAEVSESGAILSIRQADMGEPPASRISGWLIDASQLDRDVVGLRFSMDGAGGDFISRMRIEASHDLSHFSRVDAEIALVRLVQDGHRIERFEFEIPTTRANYLRITPIDSLPPAALHRIEATLASEKRGPHRMRHTLEGRMDPDDPSVVLYELEADLPVERIHVRLASPNTLIEARLESAAELAGPWRVLQSGVFYYFEKEGGIRNAWAPIRGSSNRHFRLVTSGRGGGLLEGPPTLEVEWSPEQLLYVERDAGPSMLAVGRAGTKDGSLAPEALLMMAERSDFDRTLSTASLGPEAELAGVSVLERKTPMPWRSIGLWALLLVSVGVVLGLSLRLMRSRVD
jgi:Protein of unknown function (DUF3999)